MVFDWFQRRQVQPPAAEPPAEPQTEAQAPAAEEPPVSEAAAAEPVEEISLLASPQPAPVVPPGEGGIDADALAWAREAYARLKAEQQAASALATPPPPPAPPAIEPPAAIEVPVVEAQIGRAHV
mgnify:CR=1 FL=1